MSGYYWDSKIDYLSRTRWLYYNDDYLEFLVKSVWKITSPVRIIDFGCGYGYLGTKLLPLLPEGSTYTGVMELFLSKVFMNDTFLTYAANMKITTGVIER